tara:strand:- start:5657 stop:5905 length:249 start_codon:yes stop_codon:yes gene_type:complete
MWRIRGMTRKNYPRLRNGKLEGTGMPPHFLDEKKKEVIFHIKGGFPTTMLIPTWMKYFPPDYKGYACRCEETFYRMRAKVNE